MLRVLEPGFFTSVQDRGRYQNRCYGVPISGFMDDYSAQFANLVLGNKIDMTVLEITLKGPDLVFYSPTQIAISGAFMKPEVNGIPVPHNQPISIKPDDNLRLHSSGLGMRCYIAVKGGFNTQQVLGSRSYHESITKKSKLMEGDLLPYREDTSTVSNSMSKLKFDDKVFSDSTLLVYLGPEFQLLSQSLKNKLLGSDFTISSLNNRMAYQFDELMPNSLENILTGPVIPGTIQLTPSGQLIALMKDCQTTGGYPRILQLSPKAMNILSQKSVGKVVKFRLKE